MSPLKANDPMSFISPSPLPIKSHQGLRITARSEERYSCASPSRQEVCQWNYERRRKQLTEEGYQAPNYRPYQLLGDPLILEDRQLILYALGQLEDEQLDDLTHSKQEEGAKHSGEEKKTDNAPSEAQLPRKYIIRRCTKTQRCLSQEVLNGRKMVNLAKLGHGFFTMIKQEEQAREDEALREELDLADRHKREWQPAVLESSDEEGHELAKDEALSFYMSDGDEERPDSQTEGVHPPEASLGTSVPVPSQGSTPKSPVTPSPGSKKIRKCRRKKRFHELARPYTPSHSNINFDFEDCDDPDLHTLFRQLCALNWILEAMMTEPPLAMESITKCWNIKYRELRQNTFCKTSQQRLRKERHMENKWNMFVTHPGAGHLRGKRRVSLNRQMRSMSMQSHQGVLQRAPSQVSITTNRTTIYEDSPSLQDDDAISTPREAARGFEWDSGSHITEVDELKSSIGRAERSASIVSERSNSRALSSAEHRQLSRKKSTLSEHQLEERNNQEQPVDQVSSWVATTNKKLASSDDRPASVSFSRKKSFKPSFPSKKHSGMAEKLRNKFADVTEDKALMLHDQLEALERKKYARVEQKFRVIDCKKNAYISLQLSDFRAVMERDREASAEENRKKKKLEDESKWFQELVRLLPSNIWSDHQCAAMMDKLQSMGKIESRKITPQKFLNVLTGLRHWELCAPDVRAAIEFVRDKVVGMSVEEFQAWYELEIEDIRRAKSAPPLNR